MTDFGKIRHIARRDKSFAPFDDESKIYNGHAMESDTKGHKAHITKRQPKIQPLYEQEVQDKKKQDDYDDKITSVQISIQIVKKMMKYEGPTATKGRINKLKFDLESFKKELKQLNALTDLKDTRNRTHKIWDRVPN